MRIDQLLDKADGPVFSFEFFPPKIVMTNRGPTNTCSSPNSTRLVSSTLMRSHGILDRELVQSEPACDVRELVLGRLEKTQPNDVRLLRAGGVEVS